VTNIDDINEFHDAYRRGFASLTGVIVCAEMWMSPSSA
jgi:hypothetical protein